jgi:hypothetical protein
LQKAWGCTAVGLKPRPTLTRGQQGDIEDWQRITRTKTPCATCPLAQTRHPAPWLVEVTRVVRTMERTKGGMTFRQCTGRDPHIWDVRAVDTLLAVNDDVTAANDKAREREQAIRDAQRGAK